MSLLSEPASALAHAGRACTLMAEKYFRGGPTSCVPGPARPFGEGRPPRALTATHQDRRGHACHFAHAQPEKPTAEQPSLFLMVLPEPERGLTFAVSAGQAVKPGMQRMTRPATWCFFIKDGMVGAVMLFLCLDCLACGLCSPGRRTTIQGCPQTTRPQTTCPPAAPRARPGAAARAPPLVHSQAALRHPAASSRSCPRPSDAGKAAWFGIEAACLASHLAMC